MSWIIELEGVVPEEIDDVPLKFIDAKQVLKKELIVDKTFFDELEDLTMDLEHYVKVQNIKKVISPQKSTIPVILAKIVLGIKENEGIQERIGILFTQHSSKQWSVSGIYLDNMIEKQITQTIPLAEVIDEFLKPSTWRKVTLILPLILYKGKFEERFVVAFEGDKPGVLDDWKAEFVPYWVVNDPENPILLPPSLSENLDKIISENRHYIKHETLKSVYTPSNITQDLEQLEYLVIFARQSGGKIPVKEIGFLIKEVPGRILILMGYWPTELTTYLKQSKNLLNQLLHSLFNAPNSWESVEFYHESPETRSKK